MSLFKACERLIAFRSEETVWVQGGTLGTFTTSPDGETDLSFDKPVHAEQLLQWVWDGKRSGHLLTKLFDAYTLFMPQGVEASATREEAIDSEFLAFLQNTVPLPRMGVPYGYVVDGILQCLMYWQENDPWACPPKGMAVYAAPEAQLPSELYDTTMVNMPLFWNMVEQGRLVNLRHEIKKCETPVTWHHEANRYAIAFNGRYFIDIFSAQPSAQELQSLLGTEGVDFRLSL